ncbi:molybdopterin molybdenumtransferase [Clostridiales bacterium]|nr:molybdopterin molybdenumtransferase [Clostridiales bacterium]
MIPIWDTLGRTTVDDIVAKLDNPPFPRSPYDGYAIRAADTGTERLFRVVGRSFAGSPYNGTLGELEAVRIMTGGVIPDEADCVVPQEETDFGEHFVKINCHCNSGDNYINRGEDFSKGQTIIRKNTRITASHAALAVAGGINQIKVYRKIKTAVISTGDELVKPGNPLKTGCIYDTNLIYTSLRLSELEMEPVAAMQINDNFSELTNALDYACRIANMVIMTGGVSVGQRDLVPSAIEKAGASVIFHGIAIKPGMPTLFAIWNKKVPVIALSGNPFAAMVGFEVIVRPALALLSRNKKLLPKMGEAVLENSFDKNSSTRRFIKAYVNDNRVSIPELQGNGSLLTTAECNCLIDVSAETKNLKEKSRVKIIYV